MGYRRRRRQCWVLNDFYETACCKFYRREHLPLHCTVLFFHPTYIIMGGFLWLGDGGICITHKQGVGVQAGYTFGFFIMGRSVHIGHLDCRTDGQTTGPWLGGPWRLWLGAKWVLVVVVH